MRFWQTYRKGEQLMLDELARCRVSLESSRITQSIWRLRLLAPLDTSSKLLLICGKCLFLMCWYIRTSFLGQIAWTGSHARLQSGVLGSLENHKAIWYLSNTGPDPLEYHKASEPHSMLGRRWPAFRVIWILSPPLILKKVVGPHLLKLSGSAHGSYCSVEPAQFRQNIRCSHWQRKRGKRSTIWLQLTLILLNIYVYFVLHERLFGHGALTHSFNLSHSDWLRLYGVLATLSPYTFILVLHWKIKCFDMVPYLIHPTISHSDWLGLYGVLATLATLSAIWSVRYRNIGSWPNYTTSI